MLSFKPVLPQNEIKLLKPIKIPANRLGMLYWTQKLQIPSDLSHKLFIFSKYHSIILPIRSLLMAPVCLNAY